MLRLGSGFALRSISNARASWKLATTEGKAFSSEVEPDENELKKSNSNDVALEALPSNLAAHVRHVQRAIGDARASAKIAAIEDSDDQERNQATIRTRFALEQYKGLLEKANNHTDAVESLLKHDVQAMKDELYKSRTQRVWIGWSGWF